MTKLSHLLVLLSIQISFSVHANVHFNLTSTPLSKINYYPENIEKYLNKTHSKNNSKQNLKQALRNIIVSGHIRKAGQKDILTSSCKGLKNCYEQKAPDSYKQARKYLFGDIYLRQSRGQYFVKDVYCNQEIGENDGIGPMQIPNHRVMNCEHSWPQSKFNPNESRNTQKNDLHHLFPVNSRANSSRSNHPFGEVTGRAVNSNCTSSSIGEVNYENQLTTSFEPPLEIRGNIARALFYFSTRYNLAIDEAQEYYLRRWHREDPVDDFEVQINNRIYEIQNSRNPFIDDEELVNAIKDF
ncbi:endonuclease I family protein [Halobacteriovorax sp. YZS-1-1]|uniref:endonuclease I family protein n=1 Tax=unclassified Halobacteriovorax TaxID=2639665 RepID=UPI00399B5C2E